MYPNTFQFSPLQKTLMSFFFIHAPFIRSYIIIWKTQKGIEALGHKHVDRSGKLEGTILCRRRVIWIVTEVCTKCIGESVDIRIQGETAQKEKSEIERLVGERLTEIAHAERGIENLERQKNDLSENLQTFQSAKMEVVSKVTRIKRFTVEDLRIYERVASLFDGLPLLQSKNLRQLLQQWPATESLDINLEHCKYLIEHWQPSVYVGNHDEVSRLADMHASDVNLLNVTEKKTNKQHPVLQLMRAKKSVDAQPLPFQVPHSLTINESDTDDVVTRSRLAESFSHVSNTGKGKRKVDDVCLHPYSDDGPVGTRPRIFCSAVTAMAPQLRHLMKKQEKSRQAVLTVTTTEFKAMQAHLETVLDHVNCLAIILWPFVVAGALLGSMLASIIFGYYAAIVVYQLSSWKGRGKPNFLMLERALNLSVLLVRNVRPHSSNHNNSRSCSNDHPHNSSPNKGPQGGYHGGQGRQLQGERGCGGVQPHQQGRGRYEGLSLETSSDATTSIETSCSVVAIFLDLHCHCRYDSTLESHETEKSFAANSVVLPHLYQVRNKAYESRMDLLSAVIIGPAGTPYHDGIFVFDIHFPPTYPSVPLDTHLVNVVYSASFLVLSRNNQQKYELYSV
ncbi:Ubiquitin-conjugating enzyme, E2 [Artemisia annua]|uniref:Ubiquitin-conjugating enzyme, E2 n=1 Tax=Artemisia annua TaxID=35608 RepID=A0A2U1LDY0_ARTAN|nr:Ubiquitin-conjugating enzyme, E2 [Artemisia annua]